MKCGIKNSFKKRTRDKMSREKKFKTEDRSWLNKPVGCTSQLLLLPNSLLGEICSFLDSLYDSESIQLTCKLWNAVSTHLTNSWFDITTSWNGLARWQHNRPKCLDLDSPYLNKPWKTEDVTALHQMLPFLTRFHFTFTSALLPILSCHGLNLTGLTHVSIRFSTTRDFKSQEISDLIKWLNSLENVKSLKINAIASEQFALFETYTLKSSVTEVTVFGNSRANFQEKTEQIRRTTKLLLTFPRIQCIHFVSGCHEEEYNTEYDSGRPIEILFKNISQPIELSCLETLNLNTIYIESKDLVKMQKIPLTALHISIYSTMTPEGLSILSHWKLEKLFLNIFHLEDSPELLSRTDWMHFWSRLSFLSWLKIKLHLYPTTMAMATLEHLPYPSLLRVFGFFPHNDILDTDGTTQFVSKYAIDQIKRMENLKTLYWRSSVSYFVEHNEFNYFDREAFFYNQVVIEQTPLDLFQAVSQLSKLHFFDYSESHPSLKTNARVQRQLEQLKQRGIWVQSPLCGSLSV